MRSIPAPTPDFNVYIARPETRWIMRDPEDSVAPIYAKGFLPYSGSAQSRDIFYSARSARVDLKRFALSSENRRIAKRFDGMFQKERVPASTFSPDDAFWEFCLSYFRDKHGPDAMPRARLEVILASDLLSNVIIYRKEGAPIAYVLEAEDGEMAHFWQSFYDLSYARQSLGLWLILDCIRDNKERGLSYYYLGTLYGGKALYKTNFEPLEWWDGEQWSADIARLKELSRAE